MIDKKIYISLARVPRLTNGSDVGELPQSF